MPDCHVATQNKNDQTQAKTLVVRRLFSFWLFYRVLYKSFSKRSIMKATFFLRDYTMQKKQKKYSLVLTSILNGETKKR